MMSLFHDINSNMHSQRGRWEQGRSPVGCRPRLHRFNIYLFGFVGVVRGLHPTDFYFMRILFNGALKNSTLQKHYNLTYFFLLLFFNVKISPYKKWSKL